MTAQQDDRAPLSREPSSAVQCREDVARAEIERLNGEINNLENQYGQGPFYDGAIRDRLQALWRKRHDAMDALLALPHTGQPVEGDKDAEIARLRLFLSEIAAMGPADEEWDADTLESAVTLAKRALSAAPASPQPREGEK